MSPSKTTNNQGGNKATDLPQVKIPAVITVKQLAIELDTEPVRVIKQLMRHGIMANVNQTIDYDTAAEITSEFGYIAKHKITSRVA
ncbi:MAG: translation initiation factor IF-2 N-terminal domain-containing protein, partial [Chloroflexota bacterium]|nr:translation initiation factor IF-2 N-terminal domain-containing protein [Chloroflexota bacterium]